MSMDANTHPARRHLLLLAGAAVLQGCGAQPIIEAAPAAEGAAEGVTVRAEPRVQVDQQMATFRTNLRGVGVVPILVVIRNGSDVSLGYRAPDIQLQVGQTVLGTEAPENVAVRMRQTSNAGISAGVVGAALIGAPVGLLAWAALSATERHENRSGAEAVRRNEGSFLLQEGEVAPGAEARGYVFFVPPAGVRRFNEGTLRVPLQSAGATAPITIDVPLTGLGFIPV